MKTNGAAVLLVLCTSMLVLLEASLFSGVDLVVNEDGDHCRIEGKLYRANSVSITDNCFKCRCGEEGDYNCWGVGFSAGTMRYPDGCSIRIDNCYEGEVLQVTPIVAVCEHAGEKIDMRPKRSIMFND